MKTIYIDFSEIGDLEDFFLVLKKKDAVFSAVDTEQTLCGALSNSKALPLHLEFVNMSVEQLETFDEVICTLEDLNEVLDDFSFTYFLEQYED